MANKVTTCFMLDPNVCAKLAKLAEIEDRSKSYIANRVLREFLSKYPDEEAPTTTRIPFKKSPAPACG
jgi:predicted transcriptional regulator